MTRLGVGIGVGSIGAPVVSVITYERGETDITTGLGANMSASTTYSGYPASNAIDNNNQSFWTPSNEHVPEWIKIDFGAGVQKRIYSYSISAGWDYAPKSWTLQGSNDNTNFTDLDSQSNITFAGGSERKEFTLEDVSELYRYIRLYVTLAQGGWSNIVEWELFEAVEA